MIVSVAAMLLLNIAPGPDMLYVIARGVGQGRAAGIAYALGAGAACLIYPGVRMLPAQAAGKRAPAVQPARLDRIFQQTVALGCGGRFRNACKRPHRPGAPSPR